VRHDSTDANSHYRPGQPGHDFKPEARPLAGEPVIAKTTNSAFIGTRLEEMLRAAGHTSLVVAGVITNNSVEATVRMAGNLGFATRLVGDACFTFGRNDWDGHYRSSDQVHAMSLANLDGEYCTVIITDEAVDANRVRSREEIVESLTHLVALIRQPLSLQDMAGGWGKEGQEFVAGMMSQIRDALRDGAPPPQINIARALDSWGIQKGPLNLRISEINGHLHRRAEAREI
jgi:hypothetical protein